MLKEKSPGHKNFGLFIHFPPPKTQAIGLYILTKKTNFFYFTKEKILYLCRRNYENKRRQKKR